MTTLAGTGKAGFKDGSVMEAQVEKMLQIFLLNLQIGCMVRELQFKDHNLRIVKLSWLKLIENSI